MAAILVLQIRDFLASFLPSDEQSVVSKSMGLMDPHSLRASITPQTLLLQPEFAVLSAVGSPVVF